MSRSVHIVALAARTAVGLTAESTAAAVRAGVSRVREHPLLVDAAGDALRCGFDGAIAPNAFGAERMFALAGHALAELAAKLTDQRPCSAPVRVLLALPEPRPGFSPQAATRLASRLGEVSLPKVPRLHIELSEPGHAGALRGLERAFQDIERGRDELCIVAGVDSYLEADTLDWLDAERRLARAAIRSGFAPGEAAAVLAVASDGARSALGLTSLARVRAVSCAQEKRAETCDEGLMGEGMAEALRRAFAALRPGELVSDVYLDVNGERSRSDDWGFALMRTGPAFRDGTDYRTAVSACGEVGAASGALACALAVQAWRRAHAQGPLALACASSWSGLRGAAILEESGA